MTEKSKSPQSAGGRACAIKSRKAALERYYANPNICKYCQSIIPVPPDSKVGEIRVKKFCNNSCSAKFNNQKRNPKQRVCYCGEKIDSYYKPCPVCRRVNIRTTKPCPKCGIAIQEKTKLCRKCRINEKSTVCKMTKGDIFRRSKNWTAARVIITGHARKVYKKSGRAKVCSVCGYDKYVEVCHKRPVSDFPDDATIEEINDIKNLEALCPNHHWEFDHGFLKLENL